MNKSKNMQRSGYVVGKAEDIARTEALRRHPLPGSLTDIVAITISKWDVKTVSLRDQIKSKRAGSHSKSNVHKPIVKSRARR